MNTDAVKKFISEFNIQEPLKSAFEQNPSKDRFSHMADMLVYNKMVDIAQRSGWKPKGIEAVASIL